MKPTSTNTSGKFSRLRLKSMKTSTSNTTTATSTPSNEKISIYFSKPKESTPTPPIIEIKDDPDSPYKNCMSEMKLIANNSTSDENDFHSPILPLVKPPTRLSKPPPTKPRRKKAKVQKNTLVKMTQNALQYSDVDPEHLQMALALSRSTYEAEGNEPEPEEEVPAKIANVLTTLEQYGFNSKSKLATEFKRSDSRENKIKKTRKKSKFRYITPVLNMRTAEDRQSLIDEKIAQILSDNLSSKSVVQSEDVKVYSEFLQPFSGRSLFYCGEIESFYVKSLKLDENPPSCGSLLRDWKTLRGRSVSPEPVALEVPEIAELDRSCSPDLFASFYEEKERQEKAATLDVAFGDDFVQRSRSESLSVEGEKTLVTNEFEEETISDLNYFLNEKEEENVDFHSDLNYCESNLKEDDFFKSSSDSESLIFLDDHKLITNKSKNNFDPFSSSDETADLNELPPTKLNLPRLDICEISSDSSQNSEIATILNNSPKQNELSLSQESICISDEELNYSNNYSTPSRNIKTPTRDLVTRDENNVTPMADYRNMNTPTIVDELDKFGIKPLKRQRGVRLLEYLYDCMHPFVDDDESDPEDRPIKRAKNMDEIIGEKQDLIEIAGDSIIQFDSIDDLIFERRQPAKLQTCRIPLQIVWFNFVACNPQINENILLYEPLQLEVIHAMLKEQGFKFHIQDLLLFLDKKCITFRSNYGAKSKKP